MSANLFPQDWQLVWSDEFDGETLNLDKWEYMLGNGTDYGLPAGWGNNELEWYRSENVACENGILRITAKKENYNGADYTSGRIRTKDKGDWTPLHLAAYRGHGKVVELLIAKGARIGHRAARSPAACAIRACWARKRSP